MELNLFLTIILPPLILLWFFLHEKFYTRQNESSLLPPGPPRFPIIGNLHQLNFANLHGHLYQLSHKYGPLMSLRLGSLTAIVVSSAEIAKEALSTHDRELAGRPTFYGQMKISCNGLDVTFAQYGEYWREIRKINVLHLLSLKRVLSFRPIRYNEVSRTINIISQLTSQSKPINLSEITIYLVNSIICRIAFGKRYDDDYRGDKTKSKFQDLLHELQAVAGSFYMVDYFPYMGWVDKLVGRLKWVDKVCKDLDFFLQEIIDDHLVLRKSYEHQEDIIDVLLQLQKDHSLQVHLTMDHIKCQLMDIFTAGTDTSSATLVWAMSELIKNPKSMNKVQQEVRSIKHENIFDNHSQECCHILEDDLDKLIYLKAVVKETLRLHPPAPLAVPHLATQTCKIKGYEIPKGAIVYVNLWAIGRDPEYWENPEEFCPERFLESAKNIDFRGQDFGFIPFGTGRRGCPGLNLGVIIIELALANLLYEFKWELPHGMKKEDIDSEVRPGIAMHKKNDLILMAKTY
ncbi:cytochrome P450 71A1-like [Impatiens glandulifera]|uniref:cytochrome P450 71A1-like n=1 Tax=Impatiens glandulifera TaxID=253017 RepID=UPI001FB077B8|nr:cytochrome P450 71A1-like [Impatiens glandulifera]